MQTSLASPCRTKQKRRLRWRRASTQRYPGQLYDSESGTHYNYFRDYEPGRGGYIESDPIGLAGGISTYGYVGGNPIRRYDEFGLLSCDCETNKSKQPNYVKLGTSFGNFGVGTYSVFAGAGKVVGGLGLAPATTTVAGPVGALPPAAMVAWGVWNINSGVSAWNRGFKLWDEAWCEDPSDGKAKNLWGLAPAGTEYDDDDEPKNPLDYIRSRGWWKVISEAGFF